MSQWNHTPLGVGEAASHTVINSRLSELDAAIGNNNLAATSDPTASNDETQGYIPGSRWVNTLNDTLFLCVDATSGAAVWRQVTVPDYAFVNTLIISGGQVGLSGGGSYIIAAESGTTDDLDTITGGSDGDIIYLKADSGDTITLTDAGNIDADAAQDVSGDTVIMLIYDGSNWVNPIAGSNYIRPQLVFGTHNGAGNGYYANFAVIRMFSASDGFGVSWVVPDDYGVLEKVEVVGFSEGNATLDVDWSYDLTAEGSDVDPADHAGSDTSWTLSVTDDIVERIDVLSILPGLKTNMSAGDVCSIRHVFQSGPTSWNVLAVNVVYSR